MVEKRNKQVCYMIFSIFSNELFDDYCFVKNVKKKRGKLNKKLEDDKT